jgi:hypothetical protein
MKPSEPFKGSERLWRMVRLAAFLGLGLTALGTFLSPRQAAFSYLLGFSYWAGISVAALILLGIFHAG